MTKAQIAAVLLAAGCTVGAFKSGQDHPRPKRVVVGQHAARVIPAKVDCTDHYVKARPLYGLQGSTPYRWHTIAYTPPATSNVPEAASWALLAAGLAGLGFKRRKST